MRGYCNECKKDVILFKKRPSHGLHLVGSIFTGGLWTIPWICFCIFDKYICKECNTSNVKYNKQDINKNAMYYIKKISLITILIISLCGVYSWLESCSRVLNISDEINDTLKQGADKINTYDKVNDIYNKSMDENMKKGVERVDKYLEELDKVYKKHGL
jgi:hypothetical protein